MCPAVWCGGRESWVCSGGCCCAAGGKRARTRRPSPPCFPPLSPTSLFPRPGRPSRARSSVTPARVPARHPPRSATSTALHRRAAPAWPPPRAPACLDSRHPGRSRADAENAASAACARWRSKACWSLRGVGSVWDWFWLPARRGGAGGPWHARVGGGSQVRAPWPAATLHASPRAQALPSLPATRVGGGGRPRGGGGGSRWAHTPAALTGPALAPAGAARPLFMPRGGPQAWGARPEGEARGHQRCARAGRAAASHATVPAPPGARAAQVRQGLRGAWRAPADHQGGADQRHLQALEQLGEESWRPVGEGARPAGQRDVLGRASPPPTAAPPLPPPLPAQQITEENVLQNLFAQRVGRR